MIFQPELLKGKSALVTGGGTGICRGLSLALASHGCNVAITSRKAEHLESTRQEIEALGVEVLAITGDVRDPSAVEQTVTRTLDTFGQLDILVNGAAGNFLCLAEDLSPNGFGAVVDIDLKGTFHMCKAALPHLKIRGGVVLNVSATLHYLGTAAQLHVSSAKAGVDALTRVLAVEWGPYGIRVNGIAPGPVAETEGVRRLLVGLTKDRVVRMTPLGRLGAIQDVCDAALFLCALTQPHSSPVSRSSSTAASGSPRVAWRRRGRKASSRVGRCRSNIDHPVLNSACSNVGPQSLHPLIVRPPVLDYLLDRLAVGDVLIEDLARESAQFQIAGEP